MDTIIDKDKALLVWLNGLGNEHWDSFWLSVTDQYTWIPLYILLLVLLFRYYGWKKTIALLVLVTLLVAFTDQFVNLIKNTTQRLRPCNDPSLQGLIRVVKQISSYSFVSGHATNSFAVTVFMIASLRKFFKPVYLILLWTVLFAYSRIYLGVHFPMDVFCGMLLGLLIGYAFYRFSLLVLSKVKG